MNSHQRRKATRALSLGKHFRDYDFSQWVGFAGSLERANNQVGRLAPLIKRAAVLAFNRTKERP